MAGERENVCLSLSLLHLSHYNRVLESELSNALKISNGLVI
jgi:hypothetical protein